MSNLIQKATQSAGLKSPFEKLGGKNPSEVMGAIAGVNGPQQAAAVNGLITGNDSDQTQSAFTSSASKSGFVGESQNQVPQALAIVLAAVAEALNLGEQGGQASKPAARKFSGADGAAADQAAQTMGAAPAVSGGGDGAKADQTIRPTFSSGRTGSEGGGK